MNKNSAYKIGGFIVVLGAMYLILKNKPQIVTAIAQTMPSLVPGITGDFTPATYDITLDAYTPHDYSLPAIDMGNVYINHQEQCSLCMKQRQSIAPAATPDNINFGWSLPNIMNAIQLPFGGGASNTVH